LPVLGADTTVVHDGLILGKPASPEQHLRMLMSLSGRKHDVFTGICVVTADGWLTDVVRSEVQFVRFGEPVARAYVNTGEGNDKAGGYGIQGLGGIFVKRLVGSYSAVVGLPLAETETLLGRSGLDTWRSR
jgi:septum formation protein